MTFQWTEFFIPLQHLNLLTALLLGVILGVATGRVSHTMTSMHMYWHVAGGAIFFIPLGILRALQESETWERYFSMLVLWAIFSLGMHIGDGIPDDFQDLLKRYRGRNNAYTGDGDNP